MPACPGEQRLLLRTQFGDVLSLSPPAPDNSDRSVGPGRLFGVGVALGARKGEVGRGGLFLTYRASLLRLVRGEHGSTWNVGDVGAAA